MKKDTRAQKVKVEKQSPFHEDTLPFSKENYTWMGGGFLLILIGFALMGGSENIYGFVKLTLGPLMAIAGFILVIAAIMRQPRIKE